MTRSSTGKLSCVISGSMRRHLGAMGEAATALEALAVEVLSPLAFAAEAETDGFVFVAGDEGTPLEIQRRHLASISESDFLLLVCPDGYVGLSAAQEVGYALALDIPIFATVAPEEAVLSGEVLLRESIGEIVEQVAAWRGRRAPQLRGLTRLQQWAAAMVEARGFADESLDQKWLLLVEEVGELTAALHAEGKLAGQFPGMLEEVELLRQSAEAARRASRIATSSERKESKSDEEMADLLALIAVLANASGADLQQAFAHKAEADASRRWRR